MLPSERWFRGLAVCSPMRCAVSSCCNASSTFRYGLLTASEVAQLKLNADWVILYACNTAAADGTPGANGLSGLAKAFFYAGKRHPVRISSRTANIADGNSTPSVSISRSTSRPGGARRCRENARAYSRDISQHADMGSSHLAEGPTPPPG